MSTSFPITSSYDSGSRSGVSISTLLQPASHVSLSSMRQLSGRRGVFGERRELITASGSRHKTPFASLLHKSLYPSKTSFDSRLQETLVLSEVTVHVNILQECSVHKPPFTSKLYETVRLISHHSRQCPLHKSSFSTVHFPSQVIIHFKFHKTVSFTSHLSFERFTIPFLHKSLFASTVYKIASFPSHSSLQQFTRVLPSQVSVYSNASQACSLHKPSFIPKLHKPVRFTSHRSFQPFTRLFASQVIVHSYAL